MIDIQVQQRPEGWIYDWADVPTGSENREGWTNAKYPAETLDECLDRLYESIREKLPVGKLQGDEKFSVGVVSETETRSIVADEKEREGDQRRESRVVQDVQQEIQD